MSAKVIINSTSLDRKLAAMAILTQRSLIDCVNDGAKRFVVAAIRNTAPMILSKSPSLAKREWIQKLTHHYETHRLSSKGYRKYNDVKKIIAAKKKKLGRSASGWNAAARVLKARSPAWVRRHGSTEGFCRRLRRPNNGIRIEVTNSVPYNQGQTLTRAVYALRRVERGFDGNLRALKRKMIRSVR